MALSRATKFGLAFIIFGIFWIIGYYKTMQKDCEYSHFVVLALPSYMLIVFGCYALFEIGKGLFFLDDYPSEYKSLLADIKRAEKYLEDKKVL